MTNRLKPGARAVELRRATWLLRPVVVGLISLAALIPLFSAQFPRSADGRPHLFRAVELNWLIENGHLWTRFAPDLAYGYGYPLFNYYAPLTYYLVVGLHRLGLDFVPALLTVFALAIGVGAWGAFTLTEEWFGLPGAGVAAAVYAFGPYTLFNVITRGAAPEALAVALLPWLLWSLQRALASSTALNLARLAALYAALLFLHNLSAVVMTGLLAAWGAMEVVLSWRVGQLNRRAVGLTVAALACGLALGAYFWLPAPLETGAVQVSQLTTPTDLDYRNYFSTPAQLLRPWFTFDPRLEPPTIPVALGVPQMALALAGVLALGRCLDARVRWRIGLLAIFFLSFVVLNLRATQFLWERIGLLRLMQFPWRFLGPATMFAALLAGAAVNALPLTQWRRGWLAPLALVVLTALYGFGWTYVTRYPDVPSNPQLSDLYAYEVESGGFGLTSTGEFLPATVKELPPVDGLRERYAAGPVIDRLERDSLPASVAVLHSRSQLLEAEATLRSDQPFDVTFLWFDFPGWQAEVDGQPAAIHPTDPHGFISVRVPGGEHRLRVYFGTTPVRQAAAAISLGGLLGLFAVAWLARRMETSPSPLAPLPLGEGPGVRVNFLLSLALAGLALGALRVALDERDSPFRYSSFDGQTVRGVAQPLDINFGNQLNLIGFDPPASGAQPTPADQPLTFTLYWKLYEPVTRNYSIAAHMWDEHGQLVGQADSQNPGGGLLTRWLPGGYTRDTHSLHLYPGVPPGTYRLMVGVYSAGGPNLDILDAGGNPQGTLYEVAQFAVAAPTRPASDAELNLPHPIKIDLGAVQLIGLHIPADRVKAGDSLAVLLYWRILRTPATPLDVHFEHVAEDGTRTPLGTYADLPIAQLVPGAAWRKPYAVTAPPTATGGTGTLQVSLLDEGGSRHAGPVALGALTIEAPTRTFTAPAIESPLAARFGEGIHLLGYRAPAVARPGEVLPVTLYWQSVALVAERYTVFIHLLNQQGQIAAQSDSQPVQGTRPTTGWLPQEVIVDEYALSLPVQLPPGRYRLTAGLYDPQTGARLDVTLADGSMGDHVELRAVSVTMP